MISGILLLLVGCPHRGFAQETSSDLTALELEELMDLDVVPVDVMGSHLHLAGEWMVGYRYGYMAMRPEGNAARDFPVVPTHMRMHMHMVSLMYGVTDDLTLMAMIPYKSLSMDHATRQGREFTTASAGLGDVQLKTHYALYRRNLDVIIGSLALHLPTGSINVRGDTPTGEDQKLPYPMQLGSGTVDVSAELAVVNVARDWAWGGFAGAAFRLGENANSYQLGNEYLAGAWLTRRVTSWLALLVHLNVHAQGRVRGADPELNATMVPTADPTRLGGTWMEWQPGVSVYVPQGLFEGQRLTLRVAWPFYEDTNGIPLRRNWRLLAAWQWTF